MGHLGKFSIYCHLPTDYFAISFQCKFLMPLSLKHFISDYLDGQWKLKLEGPSNIHVN